MAGVLQGPAEELDDLRGSEGFEDINFCAREKRGDDFKGRIFCGGADEENVAGFDVRQEGVLLGFVEAVDFVDEDDGADAGAGAAFGFGHDFFDFFYAAEDGAEGDEFAFRETSDEASESGFAAAGRAPEEHGAKIVRFNLDAEGFAGAEEFFLADEFVEGAGAHALGERLQARGGFRFRHAGEEGHGNSLGDLGSEFDRAGEKRVGEGARLKAPPKAIDLEYEMDAQSSCGPHCCAFDV